MTRTLKTIMKDGKVAVEYKKDGDTISFQYTHRPLAYIARVFNQVLNELDNDIPNITDVTVTIDYN